jgi:CDP-diacylglycerol--glycerol-3-phosphate 3-phosphatidyltransferase
MNNHRHIYNLPNLVSLVRILMAPILIWLAVMQQPELFIAALIFTVFTDVLDGFLARHLQQITEMGSHLDSWGDFLVYSTMAVCAWLLWPETVIREGLYFIIILFSFTLPVLVGLLKFRTLTSYHTWSVKLAVAVTVVSYILLFADILHWPFRVAAVLCALAALEEIAITLVIKHEQVDVRTLWQAWRLNKSRNTAANNSNGG